MIIKAHIEPENYDQVKRLVTILKHKIGRKAQRPTIRPDDEGNPGDFLIFLPRCWVSPTTYIVGRRQYLFENEVSSKFYLDFCFGHSGECQGRPEYVIQNKKSLRLFCQDCWRNPNGQKIAEAFMDFHEELRNILMAQKNRKARHHDYSGEYPTHHVLVSKDSAKRISANKD